MSGYLTIVDVDNLTLSSETPGNDPAIMLYVAGLMNADAEERKEELAAKLLDLVLYGSCTIGGKVCSLSTEPENGRGNFWSNMCELMKGS